MKSDIIKMAELGQTENQNQQPDLKRAMFRVILIYLMVGTFWFLFFWELLPQKSQRDGALGSYAWFLLTVIFPVSFTWMLLRRKFIFVIFLIITLLGAGLIMQYSIEHGGHPIPFFSPIYIIGSLFVSLIGLIKGRKGNVVIFLAIAFPAVTALYAWTL